MLPDNYMSHRRDRHDTSAAGDKCRDAGLASFHRRDGTSATVQTGSNIYQLRLECRLVRTNIVSVHRSTHPKPIFSPAACAAEIKNAKRPTLTEPLVQIVQVAPAGDGRTGFGRPCGGPACPLVNGSSSVDAGQDSAIGSSQWCGTGRKYPTPPTPFTSSQPRRR